MMTTPRIAHLYLFDRWIGVDCDLYSHQSILCLKLSNRNHRTIRYTPIMFTANDVFALNKLELEENIPIFWH